MRRARPKRRDTICEASGVRAVEIERVIAQKRKQTGDVTGGKGAGGGTAGVVGVKGRLEQDRMGWDGTGSGVGAWTTAPSAAVSWTVIYMWPSSVSISSSLRGFRRRTCQGGP
jgi:hypothetical protein